MYLNWFNYKFLPVDGYGRLGLKTVKALLRLGHTIHPNTVDVMDHPAWLRQAMGVDFSRTTVQLMPPHNMYHLPGRSIGYSMHESETLPAGWADHVNSKCEYCLVPSQWIKDVFRDNGVKVPMEVVYGAIDPEECEMALPQADRPFTIGCLADRANRKGFDLVWDAFFKAFDPNNRDVRLIIKCRPGSLEWVDFSYSSDSRLTIWKADVEHIADIYSQFDLYMFPTRAEGLGMPPREAAACGVPVVATRYSGLADDIDHWATPLEKFTLVESNMKGSGGRWAEPDVDEIVWRMRDAYTNRDVYRAKAQRAAVWLREHRTYAHAAQQITDILAYWLHGPMEAQQRFLASQPEPDHQEKEVVTA